MAVSSRRQFSAEKGDMPHVRRYHHQAAPIHRDFGSDPFTAILRDGARKLIEQAISRGTWPR